MKNGNVYEVSYNRATGMDELTGTVLQHAGEAILTSDVPDDILHGVPFVAAVHWYKGLVFPTATYVPVNRSYAEEDNNESYTVPVYHLARVTEISYAHPEGERAPRHTIQLIRPLNCKEVEELICYQRCRS